MNVAVRITLVVPPTEKHFQQMRLAAERLTDNEGSVEVLAFDGNRHGLIARITVPKARQGDVVDHIGHGFWNIDDYADCSIGFSSTPRRRTRRFSEPGDAICVVLTSRAPGL